MNDSHKLSYVKQEVLDRLSMYPHDAGSVEELADYVLLNVQRNCSKELLMSNLRVFMHDDNALEFSAWMLNLLRVNEITFGGFPEEDSIAIDGLGSLDQDMDASKTLTNADDMSSLLKEVYPEDHQQSGEHGVVEYTTDDEDSGDGIGIIRKIPSVISTARYHDRNNNNSNSRSRRRRDYPYRTAATQMFLKAVGEATQSTTGQSGARTDRRRVTGGRQASLIAANDLRHKINAARQYNKHQCHVVEVDVLMDNRSKRPYPNTGSEDEDPLRSRKRKRDRLRRFCGVAEKIRSHATNRLPEQNTVNDDVDMDAVSEEQTKTTRSDEKKESKTSVSKRSQLQKKKIRCRFWPKCARGEACEYVHPKEDCKLFPNCNFGATCLYVHPPCPKDGNCSTKDCAYTHTQGKRPKVINLPTKTIPTGKNSVYRLNNNMPSSSQCKTNVPQVAICPFDVVCRNPYCPKSHPNRARTVNRSAYKWVKPVTAKPAIAAAAPCNNNTKSMPSSKIDARAANVSTAEESVPVAGNTSANAVAASNEQEGTTP